MKLTYKGIVLTPDSSREWKEIVVYSNPPNDHPFYNELEPTIMFTVYEIPVKLKE